MWLGVPLWKLTTPCTFLSTVTASIIYPFYLSDTRICRMFSDWKMALWPPVGKALLAGFLRLLAVWFWCAIFDTESDKTCDIFIIDRYLTVIRLESLLFSSQYKLYNANCLVSQSLVLSFTGIKAIMKW
jgi:hypothetical protein